MEFSLNAAKFAKLRDRLFDTGKVVITGAVSGAITTGTIANKDGTLAAEYVYDGHELLTVRLTRHDDYFEHIANYWLHRQLAGAIERL